MDKPIIPQTTESLTDLKKIHMDAVSIVIGNGISRYDMECRKKVMCAIIPVLVESHPTSPAHVLKSILADAKAEVSAASKEHHNLRRKRLSVRRAAWGKVSMARDIRDIIKEYIIARNDIDSSWVPAS